MTNPLTDEEIDDLINKTNARRRGRSSARLTGWTTTKQAADIAVDEPIMSSKIEMPVSEYARLHQRVGFLEGLFGTLELLDDDELRPAIERGIKRYREIHPDDN